MRSPVTVVLVAVLGSGFLAASGAKATVTIAWSPVGNPANAADSTGFGAVSYPYSIGTYDVTNSQYVEFLNTKDPSGANLLGLYNENMSNVTAGGVNFDSSANDGHKYTVIAGHESYPVNYVNWYDAARFANWVNNGQGNADTETGAYTIVGGTPIPTGGLSIVRNPAAAVFLPSENEWYKAAYYNPASSSYFMFPTGSNTPPTASAPPGAANSANYASVVGVPTDVGAYTQSASPYGTFDQGGNVFQWNEKVDIGLFRGIRGGSELSPTSTSLMATSWSAVSPLNIVPTIGFRLASFPAAVLPGDVNYDHIVNGQDIARTAASWLHTGFATPGDANHDGIVNGQDIAQIATHWLQTGAGGSGAAAVPEPSAFVLAAVGGGLAFAWRRRRC